MQRMICKLFAGASSLAIGLMPATAMAQDADGAPAAQVDTPPVPGSPDTPQNPAPAARSAVTTDDTTLSTIVVNGRRPGITNIKPTATVSGLDQSITEIPRGVTTIDSALLKDIQVRSIHDLTVAAAGTYTAAFFGVAGAVQVRGSLADNYYRGFKGINNLGYYETPTESVSNIEIVRGPVSPLYGTGKLGGMINFTPKTDIAATLKRQDKVSMLATVQGGSFNLFKATLEGGIPFRVGGNDAAFYIYGYYNKNGSFYRHYNPRDYEIQAGYSMDLGPKFELNLGARYLDTKGRLASPGWNRLTQDLIDNGNYIAGGPAINLARPGAQGLLPADLQPYINQLRRGANLVTGVVAPPTAYTALDPATVRTVKLSRRNINTSPLDFNNNNVTTAYGDLIYTADDGSQLRLQGFYEALDNDMFSAAGSATYARAEVWEGRLSVVTRQKIADGLEFQAVAGGSYRDYQVQDWQNYGRRYVIWDRNDLSMNPTPDMIVNNWALNPNEADRWDFRYESKVRNVGLFLNADVKLFDALHVQGGLRYDRYDVDTINRGISSFGGALNRWYNRKIDPLSYQISVNYETSFGITPYATYANNRSLETNKGGGVDPALLINGSFLSPSNLKEIGLKGNLLNNRLYFSLSAYRQERSQRDSLSTSITTSRNEGVEFEVRAEVTPRFELLGTATFQESRQTGSGTILVTPAQIGIANPALAYAGEWTIATGQIPAMVNGYVDTTLPDQTFSLFGTYRLPFGLKLSGGGVYVGKTQGVAPGSIKAPDYVTVRALGSYTWRNFTFDVAVDNIFDEKFFYLAQAYSGYSEVAALPAPGRTFTVRLAAKF